MRIPNQHLNPLRAPLDGLLGAPANVRVLRVMTEPRDDGWSAAEIAERARVSRKSAYLVLDRLEALDAIERIGNAPGARHRLRTDVPLLDAVRALFELERARYDTMITELAATFSGIDGVVVAWVRTVPEDSAQALTVGVVARSSALASVMRAAREDVLSFESEFGWTVEIDGYTRADVPEVDWSAVRVLCGYPLGRAHEAPRDHADHDRRAESIADSVANLLRRDPSLRERALAHVETLLKSDRGPAAHDLREWRDILVHYSDARLRDFLVSSSSRAQRLRQSSPFLPALSDVERRQVDDALRAGAT